MSINLQTGSYQAPQPLPGVRSTDIQVTQKQPEQYPEPSVPAPSNDTKDPAATAEQIRFEHVAAAAQHVAGDPYPISDKSFTIFKDATGQYITRYTSLRDGRVTYVPEPKLLQQFESDQTRLKAAVQLKA